MKLALEKAAASEELFDIDCSQALPAGVTLASVGTITASPVTDPPVAFGAAVINQAPATYTDPITGAPDHVAPAGTVIQVPVSGGYVPPAAGGAYGSTEYLVHALATRSDGRAFDAVVRLVVKDAP